MQINYEQPSQGAAVTSITIASSNTVETTILTINNADYLRQSELSVYYNLTFGSASSVKLRYYLTPDNGTTYYEMTKRVDSTGILTDLPSVIDATSPQTAGVAKLVETVRLGAGNGLKITGQAVTANATLNSCYVYVRDN